MEQKKIPSSLKSRNKILKECEKRNYQDSAIIIKRISNSQDIDEKKSIRIMDIERRYLSTYVIINDKLEIKRSNITEIADENGETLWKK